MVDFGWGNEEYRLSVGVFKFINLSFFGMLGIENVCLEGVMGIT